MDNRGSFPARQRKALKLEIPATTEWTEREGTCLGRRNCPFSALIKQFTVLYRTASLSSFFLIMPNILSMHSSTVVPSYSVSSLGPGLSLSSESIHIPASGAALSACVKHSAGRGCSVCDGDESTLECRGAFNHVLPWPLNKLIFYECTSLPVPILLKGLRLLPAAFDLVITQIGFNSCSQRFC